MIAPEAWQAFGGILAVLILLGDAALALRRLGILRDGVGVRAHADVMSRVAAVEKDLADFRLHLAEHYIRRDDWVQMTSRVIGMLEDHSVMLARLDERFLAAEKLWSPAP